MQSSMDRLQPQRRTDQHVPAIENSLAGDRLANVTDDPASRLTARKRSLIFPLAVGALKEAAD